MEAEITRILLIEDNPGDAGLIREIVMEAGGGRFDLEVADRLATGLGHLKQKGGDVILLDIGLPDSQGFEVITKVCAQAKGVPVVVLTGMDDESLGIEALRRGAYDYVVKQQILGKGRALRRVLNYAVERKRMEVQREALEVGLRREKENFQSSLDDLPLGIRIVSADGDTLYANRAILENRKAMKAGKLGGKIGGKARAEKLSSIERLNLTIRQGSAYLFRRTICHARWKQRL